jgi:transcriptional regulatory protein RtcR
MTQKPNVVIGLLGTTLNAGRNEDRWQSWRPTVAICRQLDFVVKRLELLHGLRDKSLAQLIAKDVAAVSPKTTVRLNEIEFGDPWDFARVYETLFKFARSYPFDTGSEDYLIHITTGTHVAQILPVPVNRITIPAGPPAPSLSPTRTRGARTNQDHRP